MPRRCACLLALALVCLWASGTTAPRASAAAAPSDDDDTPAGRPAPAAPRRGDGYAIQLTRPMKVGQKYAWSADATVVNSVPGPGAATVVSDTVSIHLDAVVQILSVDKDGDVTEMACTVEECIARTGRERKTVLQPGRVILVEAGKWRPKLTATTGNLTIEDDLLLRAVLLIPRLDDTCSDDVFGTDKRQNVGGAWPVRAEQMVKSWAAAGYKLRPQTVSGTMKLKSAELVDGVECVRVTGRAKIEKFLPPALDLPDGIEVADATTEIRFTKLLPVDPSQQVLQDSHSLTVQLVLKKDPRSISPEAPVGKVLRTVGVKLKLLRG